MADYRIEPEITNSHTDRLAFTPLPATLAAAIDYRFSHDYQPEPI